MRQRMWTHILGNPRDDWTVRIVEIDGRACGFAMLWVAKQNPRAVAFYRRNRFELDGAEQIDPGAPMITDARMVR
ncbi:hypothetical protein [Sanguibacter sp. 25GB23B1]|uniref:hypothetical protein n=1 Tax=unclassified Sanguibacter TaxID=2645534 RepID=UPI0032AFF395